MIFKLQRYVKKVNICQTLLKKIKFIQRNDICRTISMPKSSEVILRAKE